ncbi:MAG: hypothetical protein J6V07_04255 [Clostridia bacterium]|nr:hypothetical protein [Clostridia bacterium]
MANDNPHASHRARLRSRYLASGLSGFAPHNVLELLLFHAIPRRDTNPLAHALLSRFGSVGAVLSADREALLSVPGVGPGVAGFLSACSTVAELALSHRKPRTRLADADALGCYFSSLLEEQEGVALLFLDNDFGLISEHVLPGVSVHSPRFSPTLAVEKALLHHAPLCAVAHLHADGLALPTAEDFDVTRVLRNTLEAAGVRLLEHIIVGGGRYATLLYRYSGSGVPTREVLPRVPLREETAALSELLRLGHARAEAEGLLMSYGGLYRLLSSPHARHAREGLDAGTAVLLSLLFAVQAYAAAERPVPSASEGEALGRYLTALYRAVPEELVLLLLFDRAGRHIATHTVGQGSVGEAGISCRRVAEGALFSGARLAVLAHNHPDGAAVPSEEDRAATRLIAGLLDGIGVTLLSHYVVAPDGFISVL